MLENELCEILVERNVDGILLVDQKGLVRYANPAAEDLFARNCDGLMGRPFGFPVVAGETVDIDILPLNNRPRVAELRTVEIDCPSPDRGRGFLVSLRDMTERIQLENQLRRAREIAEAATQAKNRFLANLSHELRTPLNAIVGLSSLMLSKGMGDINPEQKDALEDVLAGGWDLTHLVGNLLDLADAEAGKIQCRPSPFELAPFLENRLSAVYDLAQGRGIQLVIGKNAGLRFLVSDEHILGRVVDQLLHYSVKSSPSGGRVTVSVKRVPDSERGSLPPPVGKRAQDAALAGQSEVELVLAAQERAGGPGEVDKILALFGVEDDAGANHNFSELDVSFGISLATRLVRLVGGRLIAETLGGGRSFIIRLPHPEPGREDPSGQDVYNQMQ